MRRGGTCWIREKCSRLAAGDTLHCPRSAQPPRPTAPPPRGGPDARLLSEIVLRPRSLWRGQSTLQPFRVYRRYGVQRSWPHHLLRPAAELRWRTPGCTRPGGRGRDWQHTWDPRRRTQTRVGRTPLVEERRHLLHEWLCEVRAGPDPFETGWRSRGQEPSGRAPTRCGVDPPTTPGGQDAAGRQ
jgi:hypothetical protein